MQEAIEFNLNGKQVKLAINQDMTMLWALRVNFGLMGTKFSCGLGYCGACTILLDNVPVRSCLLAAADADGKKIITIEGLAKNGELHPVQKAFMEHDALQCGYCTPGMIMNATGLLLKNPEPTRQEIIEGMEGNLCRCGAHKRIIRAIQAAGKEMQKSASVLMPD